MTMSSEEDRSREAVVEHHHHQPPPPPLPQYGTFQGVANYPPPTYPPPPQQPITEFPQPAPPPGAHHDPSNPQYVHGYQTVPGYGIAEGRPTEGRPAEGRPPRERRLPCCGIGLGWCLFIMGFIFGAIPWYIGAFIILCARIDPREKSGYIACTIAAILATIAIVLGVTGGTGAW